MNNTLQRDQLGELENIASGGQATLFAVPDLKLPDADGPLVYKEYNDAILAKSARAIRYGLPQLLEIPDRLPQAKRDLLNARTAWPLALVLNGEQASGIIMKRIRPVFQFTMHLSAGPKETIFDLQQVLRPESERSAFEVPPLSVDQRGRLVARLAICMELFHDNGLIVGDLSSKNVAVSNPGKLSEVYPKFLDTDSFRLAGNRPPVQQGSTPDWLVPEIVEAEEEAARLTRVQAPVAQIAKVRGRAQVLDKRTDIFKFGLLALRLFDFGPDAGVIYKSAQAEQRIQETFGAKRADLLRRCRDEVPELRPEVAELAGLFTP
jgi:hypothetical protein